MGCNYRAPTREAVGREGARGSPPLKLPPPPPPPLLAQLGLFERTLLAAPRV